MAGWDHHIGQAVRLPVDNIDTDQLIPARFMSMPRDEGYGQFLLYDMRRGADGAPDPDFPLNRDAGASILIAGANFGSGSSREAAVYALVDAGFRAVIAPSFGDIFAANAINNGLLPAQVTADVRAALVSAECREVSVNIPDGLITCGAIHARFDLEGSQRAKLINGWDDIDLTRDNATQIAAFAKKRRQTVPWAWPRRRA